MHYFYNCRLLLVCFLLLALQLGCGDPPSSVEVVDSPQIQDTQASPNSTVAIATRQCKETKGEALELRGAVSAEQLSEVTKFDWLKSLQIYVSTFEPQDVSRIEVLNRLEVLRLEDVQLGDEEAASIAKLEGIRVLNLPASQLSDVGLSNLVKSLPRLELLRIGSPSITDDGLRCLSQARSLRFLHLINVPLTDEGLATFREMKDLESLYLDGGNESDSGIRELLKANPMLHFHRNQTHIAEDPNSDGH